MSDFSKIEFTLLNQDHQPSACLGRANTLRLRLANENAHALPLTGGPPAMPARPGGPFAVYLDLAVLLADPTEQAKLTVSAPGWAAHFFADDEFPTWVLSPVENQVWNSHQLLTLTVAGLTPTVQAGTYYLDVELHNLDGLPALARKLTLGVVHPPTQHLLSEAVEASLRSSIVCITKRNAPPVHNELTIRLYNRTKKPLVPESQPWDPDNKPQFILSLVTAAAAPGYYALATPNALSNIDVSVKDDKWEVELMTGTQVQWLLRPRLPEVLGTGTSGIVEITLRNIVTSFQPGPTLLYVQSLNVPGYADGFLTLLLDKLYEPMRIDYFRLTDPGEVPPGQPLPPPTLEWKVSHATNVLLSGVGPVASESDCLAVPGLFTRTYELTAFDTELGKIEQQRLTLRADPLLSVPPGSIIAWSGTLAQIPPGWLVCDGTNQTPNLRDCFVPGAGDGAHTRPFVHDRAPLHSHTVSPPPATVVVHNAGTHTHEMPLGWYRRNFEHGTWSCLDVGGTIFSGQLQPNGDHTHTAHVRYEWQAILGPVPVPRPAWYALVYLQYRGLLA